MINIDVINASNLSSSVAFQTFQQLMDGAFCYHLHCNITRLSHNLYTTVCPPTASLFFWAWQNYSNIPSSILSCFLLRILLHFKMLHPCEASCSTESWSSEEWLSISLGYFIFTYIFVHFCNHFHFFHLCLACVFILLFTHTFHTVWS